jgi:hypothetical protein
MPEQLVAQGTSQLLSQGLLGVICAFLLWYVGRLQTEIRELRAAHKVEIAEERKLNAELQESRLEESKVLLEAVSSNKSSFQALLSAIQGKAA